MSRKELEKSFSKHSIMEPTPKPPPRLRVAVLISGNGSNLQALIDHERGPSDCPYEVVVVFSNKKSAFGLQRAEKSDIPTRALNHKDFDSRPAFEEQMVAELQSFNIDLIVLAGFMRVLSPYFVNTFQGRILNIHPSLLPDFPGLHAVEQALEAGAQRSGCTVHLVDAGVDTGPVVAQEAVAVHEDDTAQTLHERIHHAEHRLYPAAVHNFCTQLLNA
jgi:formyltetrahydrofolate-dependent phosphoribosylglycinamide formyltransferase